MSKLFLSKIWFKSDLGMFCFVRLILIQILDLVLLKFKFYVNWKLLPIKDCFDLARIQALVQLETTP